MRAQVTKPANFNMKIPEELREEAQKRQTAAGLRKVADRVCNTKHAALTRALASLACDSSAACRWERRGGAGSKDRDGDMDGRRGGCS